MKNSRLLLTVPREKMAAKSCGPNEKMTDIWETYNETVDGEQERMI